MRIATWNLLHGAAIPPTPPIPPSATPPAESASRSDLAAIAEFIDRAIAPDVIAFQEVDHLQPRSGNLDQSRELAELLGAEYYFYAPTILGTPGEKWKEHQHHSTHESQTSLAAHYRRSYGIALLSKIPVLRWEILSLGRSRIGMPLAVPSQSGKGIRLMYVRDEPRIALAAILENGITIAATHLSFVPGVNLFQLHKVKKWLDQLPGESILLGDLNLPWGVGGDGWRATVRAKSYPSWGAKIQFDQILTNSDILKSTEVSILGKSGFSDHLPLAADFTY